MGVITYMYPCPNIRKTILVEENTDNHIVDAEQSSMGGKN